MMTILLVHREGHDDTILLVYTVVTKGNQMLKGSAESEAERADAPPVGMPVLSRLSVAAAAATDDGVSTFAWKGLYVPLIIASSISCLRFSSSVPSGAGTSSLRK